MAGRPFKQPSPNDWEHLEARVREGIDPAAAARERGHFFTDFRKDDPFEHKRMKELWHEARTNYVSGQLERVAEAAISQDQFGPATRALELIGKSAGMFTDRTEVEVSGPEGGPVLLTVEDARERLALRIAQAAPGNGAPDDRPVADGSGG